MPFQDVVAASKKYFPNLQIAYKDESLLMKILSILLFFNRGFMTQYTTTIGSTIYFPSQNFVKLHPVSSSVVLLHELVHLHDQEKITKPLFSISYLFPQIMIPIFFLLLLVVSWKIMLPLIILFAFPLPAFFRTHWEKRAYLSSFYVLQALGKRLNFDPHLQDQESVFLNYFHGPSYYYMWPFHNIDKEFDAAKEAAASGKRPFEDSLFDMLDDLSSKV